jgi:ribonuclease HI
MKMMKKQNFYAVRAGRKTGVFDNWPDTAKSVKGFPNAVFRKFGSRAEANAWLKDEDAVKNVDYTIYTDGSCLVNPDGPGGWALLMFEGDEQVKEVSGGEQSTTNNRMELTAAIKALQLTPVGATVRLYTDSQYLRNGFASGWLDNWKTNGWKTSVGKQVANEDLWRTIDKLATERTVFWTWQRGHVGHVENERVDHLAREEAKKLMQQ